MKPIKTKKQVEEKKPNTNKDTNCVFIIGKWSWPNLGPDANSTGEYKHTKDQL